MTVIQIIALLLGIFVLGVAAYWIITKFMSPPVQPIALTVTGVILLLILLGAFAPNMLGFKVW